MDNAEKAAEAWRDREFAKKFVENLGRNDRITVYRRVDSETGSVEETYTLYRPPAEPEPIFMSGDCAAIRQAIDSGLLEPFGDAIYKKRETAGGTAFEGEQRPGAPAIEFPGGPRFWFQSVGLFGWRSLDGF